MPDEPQGLIAAVCLRGSHKACRGRVMLPNAKDPRKRWGPCACPCGHDRGEGAKAYAEAEARGDVEEMERLAAAAVERKERRRRA